MRVSRVLPAVVVAGSLLLTGCGTRVDDAELRAGAGGGAVTLTQESLDQLKSAGAAMGGAALPGSTDTAAQVPLAPAAGTEDATSPGAGTATNTGTAATSTATLPGRPAAKATDSAACTTPGAPIALGQVGTFSGLAGAVSQASRTAIAVWVQDLNARGGLACHPVTLYARDDGADPSRAAAIVNELRAQQHVVALVGSPVLFSIGGFRTAIEQAKLPVIGGELIAPDWHESPYMFPQGASIFDQIIGFVRQGVEAGKKRVATLYCVEVSACTEGIAYAKAGGAKRAGAELVYDSAVSLTQTDFTAQCQNAKNAGADQLVLGMDGSAMTRVARSCAALGYKPLLSGLGGTISPAQATDANLRSFGLAVASGTAPWTETDTPGVREYRAALARYAPALQPDGASLGAWTSGKLVEAAIAGVAAKARGTLTSEVVLEGLGTVKNESLGGLTAALTFTPNQKHAVSSGCVFYELLTPQGWTAPRGSRKVCV